MDISVIISQMIKFFLLMAVGYFLFKVKLMDADFNRKLTNFVLRVTTPCMVVSSVFYVSDEREIGKVVNVFIVAVIMYSLLTLIGMGVAKIIRCRPENTGIYVFMMIFSNAGFMGFPIVESLLGGKALFYTAIFNMIFNIFLFTVGIKAINYPLKGGRSMSAKEIILHPGVFGAIIAIIIYFMNLHIPDIIAQTVDGIGDLTPTLAMLLMGAALAKVPVNRVFTEKRSYIFVIIKQVIIPTLCWFLIKRCIADEMIQVVTLIMLLMPIANSVVMFAIEYERNEEIAAKNVFISTLASIVLLPVMFYLLYLK